MRRARGHSAAALLALSLSLPAGVGASAGGEGPLGPLVPAAGAALPIVERIDEAHEEQARFFGEFCEQIDRVFGEQYLEDRERKVQVRAGGGTTFNDEGTSNDTTLNFALRVPLPSLERRFNLFLEIGEDISNLGAASNPNFDESNNNLSVGASLLSRYRENVETGLKVKLFWDDGSFASVYPFVRFERRCAPLRYFFEQRLVWESDGTWRTRTDFDVDRTLHTDYDFFLRLRNRVDLTFGERGAQVAHGLILRQSVFARSGLSYEVWMEYTTAGDDTSSLDDDTIAYAQIRWRGRIWRDWLEYELRPAYSVPLGAGRDQFFSFFVSLTVIWDSYFGGAVTSPAEEGGR